MRPSPNGAVRAVEVRRRRVVLLEEAEGLGELRGGIAASEREVTRILVNLVSNG